MTMLPATSLDSTGDMPAILNQKIRDRERALIIIFAGAALMAGASAAVASFQVLAFAAGLYLIILAAWALSLTWLGPVLAALIPFQLYFPVPATSFTMRAAPVFVFAVAIRLVLDRQPWSAVRGRRSSIAFLLPAALFLLAALIAALGAQDRYAAFKGIYDWLVVLLAAFAAAALAPSATTARRTLFVLIVGGVAQALLGLLQYVLGLNTVLDLLRLPVSELLYQPNLLKDRLGDLSFNWVAFDRALPFGTFINGIDYAVYLAAVLCLIIALVIARGLSLRRVPHPPGTALRALQGRCERSAAQSKVADPAPRGRTEPRAVQRGAPPSGERDDVLKALPSGAIPNMAEIASKGQVCTRNATAPLQPTHERPSAVGSRRSILALTVAALPVAVALLLTFKGSGFLALVSGMAAIALFALPRLSRTTVVVGLIVLVGALVVALPFADLIGQRAVYLLQREQGSAGSVGRLQTWSSLLQFVVQRPLFGYGLNNAIPLIEPQWTLRDGAPGFVFSTPESAYVSALVETGLVGLVALIGWLSAAVVNGYRRATEKYGSLYLGMVAALVALAFGNLTVSGLTTDQNGMLLGMLIGLIYGSQKND